MQKREINICVTEGFALPGRRVIIRVTPVSGFDDDGIRGMVRSVAEAVSDTECVEISPMTWSVAPDMVENISTMTGVTVNVSRHKVRDYGREREIEACCDTLRDVWKSFPELRFGQLLCNTVQRDGDIFTISDGGLMYKLRNFRKTHAQDDPVAYEEGGLTIDREIQK